MVDEFKKVIQENTGNRFVTLVTKNGRFIGVISHVIDGHMKLQTRYGALEIPIREIEEIRVRVDAN